MTDRAPATNWFDRGGRAYATFRPDYPAAISTFLAGIEPDTDVAVDVGCGSGQLTRKLADHFRKVIGVDPSAEQLAHAVRDERTEYLCAPAESLPLADGSASLFAAAQAAHWFDLPKFYAEVRRVGRRGSVVALISYGVPRLADPALQDRFKHYYWHEVGPYWPAERRLVDSGYADIDFPFDTIETPPLSIDRRPCRNEIGRAHV
nr:class I SAM-dependent methyltransferase [uncultured Nitratireductor sp.]